VAGQDLLRHPGRRPLQRIPERAVRDPRRSGRTPTAGHWTRPRQRAAVEVPVRAWLPVPAELRRALAFCPEAGPCLLQKARALAAAPRKGPQSRPPARRLHLCLMSAHSLPAAPRGGPCNPICVIQVRLATRVPLARTLYFKPGACSGSRALIPLGCHRWGTTYANLLP